MICLLPQCAYLSETSRMLEIWRALRALDVPVRVATHGGVHERLLAAAGVPYDLLGAGWDDRRSAAFIASAVGLGGVRQSMYSDAELRAHVEVEADYLRRHRVTVLVTGFTLTALLSSRLAGATLVTEHAGSWAPPLYERGLLPAPADPRWPVLRALPEPALRWLTNAVLPRSRFYCGGFNRVAARLRVEGVPSLAALVLGDLSLVPEIPEVVGVPPEELAAWRPAGRRSYRPATRLRYTGPLYAHLDLPLPPEVDRFLDRPGAPVVYVAITSSPPALVRHAVAALLTLEVRVLVAATVHDPDRLLDGLATGAAGDRVLVGGVLPSHLVMPRVALAVTAGGQGSTQTAMAAGTPLLGLPLQPEQDLNVVLLERQAAARRLAPRRVPTALAALAESMLADPAYRRAAGRIRDLYQRVDGPARTAEAIAGQ